MSAADRFSPSGGARIVPVVLGVVGVGLTMGVLTVVWAAQGEDDTTNWAVLGALAVLAVGVAVAAPKLLVALAVPGTLLLTRVGGALSVTDVLLAGATVAALVLVKGREMLPMRALFWAGAAYLVAALPTLVLNPFAANSVEWLHEAVLVLGSMVVGFAIGRTGWARRAVSLYVAGCVLIAVAAFGVASAMLAAGEGFGPAYLPENLHKNYIGGALAVAIVLLYAKPVWFRWPPVWAALATVVLVLGLVASGSRQGVMGAVVGLLVVALRRDPTTGRLRLVPWLVAIPATAIVFLLLGDQLESDNRFNSANQRLDWFAQAIDVWRTSPAFGVGLRWWYLPQYPQFQPPNAELEVLSSVGVVGLVGFLVMFLVAGIALWRMDPAYGTAAAAVVATRFTQAQFDLYWIAGQASLLWIVAGIAYGALVRDTATEVESLRPEPVRARA